MNILEKILDQKKKEVAERMKTFPEGYLKQQRYFSRACLSLTKALLAEGTSGIIAEFKRKSPSKGFINEHADVAAVTKSFAANGAAGLSILTDNLFFGGDTADLLVARANQIPILRKDFIIDLYQVTETKAIGADVILLIASCLSPNDVQALAKYARSIGLEVLLELHSTDELSHICEEVSIVGINNRDLKNFTVNINASMMLGKQIPSDKIKIAESGISDPETIATFRDAGFKGFLIGETFMRETDPGAALKDFIKQLT